MALARARPSAARRISLELLGSYVDLVLLPPEPPEGTKLKEMLRDVARLFEQHSGAVPPPEIVPPPANGVPASSDATVRASIRASSSKPTPLSLQKSTGSLRLTKAPRTQGRALRRDDDFESVPHGWLVALALMLGAIGGGLGLFLSRAFH